MSEPNLIADFRNASWGGRLRRLALGGLAVAVVIGTGLTIRAILRLHFHPVAESPEVEARLQRAEATAQAQPSKENDKARADGHSEHGAERPVASGPGEFPYPYEIRGMSVPIANRRQSQALYAQFTIVLDCPDSRSKEEMILGRAKIRSRLYEVAMRFSEEDFRSKEGFARFRQAIEAELKDAFGDAAPRGVALRDWTLE